MPDLGFLFPAFNDRSTDLHQTLYYARKPEELHFELIDHLLGCRIPLSAGSQKETFHTLIEETLGEECSYDIVRNIHENLNELIEEQKESPVPVELDKEEVKYLFAKSGIQEEKLENFDKQYEAAAGEQSTLLATNITNTRSFEIKTPDVIVKVNPERTDLVEVMTVNGRRCLVIGVDDHVEINGISAKTMLREEINEEFE